MKIATLADLKEAIGNIPDEILEQFGVGRYEDEFVELLCWGDEDDVEKKYLELVDKYPVLVDIGKWITNIAKVQDQSELQEDLAIEEPISSSDKIEIKIKEN